MKRAWLRARIEERLAALAYRPPDLLDPRYPKQDAYVQDISPYISCSGTRKSGKTFGGAKRLFRSAFKYPGVMSPYVALTRDSAKYIMWPELQKVNTLYGLGAEFVESELMVRLQNGSVIKLFGCDMQRFSERIRGPTYGDAIIDEAQAFRESILHYLIDDVFKPAQIKTHASVCLQGTPGPTCQGTFYQASKFAEASGYSHHFLSLWENPDLPDPLAFVAMIKKKKGWTDANPTYRREYLGEWVIDLDALVYKYQPGFNDYEELPRGHEWLRVLVIDLGFRDQAAFGITTYSLTHRDVFQEYASGESELIPSVIAGRAFQLVDTYQPYKILMDTGGLGKSIAEEFIQRYHLPIEAAEKKQKLTNQKLMNGDFVDKHIFVHKSLEALQTQYQTLVKDPKTGEEDPKLPNDLCDVGLYGYREAKHYLAEEVRPKPKAGSAEWSKQEADRMEAEAEEDLKKEEEAWWEK